MGLTFLGFRKEVLVLQYKSNISEIYLVGIRSWHTQRFFPSKSRPYPSYTQAISRGKWDSKLQSVRSLPRTSQHMPKLDSLGFRRTYVSLAPRWYTWPRNTLKKNTVNKYSRENINVLTNATLDGLQVGAVSNLRKLSVPIGMKWKVCL